MENLTSSKALAIKETLRSGRDFAAQLGDLMRERSMAADPSKAMGLIEEVMASFSRVLDALDSDETSKILPDSVCGKKRRNDSALERGGSRRRRRSSQWRTIISNTTSDEYSWRKYGQKDIHSSTFPRSYFRCTHKHDQGCQATKQVQKSEDDPSLYLISYMGQHSCNGPTIIPNLMLLSNSINEPSIISFGSNISTTTTTTNITQQQQVQYFPNSHKREGDDQEALSNLNCCVSNSEYLDLPMLSNASNCDMSFLVNSFEFGDDLVNFDQGDFFRD